MSGMFARPASASQEIYAGMQVSTSLQGQVIPYVTGRTKVDFNLVWYGDFQANGGNSSSKGGGGSSNGVSYTAAFIAALCLGPIKGIFQVFHDRSLTSLMYENLAYALGANGQAIWTGYPSGTPAIQEIPYSNIAYVATSNYNLGSSASMPNLQFEVEGSVWGYSDAFGMLDADISAVVVDYLTNPVTGAGFLGTIPSLTGTTNTFQAYCMSLGLMVSNYENNQRAATDFIKELMQIANSDVVDSCGILRIVPYADTAVSGTTADGTAWSYAPNLTPIYIFDDDDYCPKKGQEPLILKRKATTDTYNIVNIEYLDRSDYYNPSPASAQDNWDISIRGPRCMATVTLHEITNALTAKTVAQLILNTQLYERNTYIFRVRCDYWLLEPMDYIAINDSNLGITNLVCRIVQIDEDENNYLTFTVMEVPGTIRNTPQYNWSGAQGYFQNFEADPGTVQAPAIFVMPPIAAASSAGITLGIAVCGQTSEAFWGGCDIYASDDGGNTYTWVGEVGGNGPARYGKLTAPLPAVADPDTSSTLAVVLANTTLQLSTAVTDAQADASQTLILVGSGATAEVMSYGHGTLVGSGAYDLSYLRRGLYGSTPEPQVTGAQFVRLDPAIFQMPIDPGMAGETLYFKFCSFNAVSRADEELSAVTAYPYTIPTSLLLNVQTPAGLIASGSAAVNGTSAYMVSTAAAAWGTASVYSSQSYTNGCSAECYSSQTTYGGQIQGFMMGLTRAPTASNSYTNLAYAWYFADPSHPNGMLQIYEGGTYIGNFGTYTASDFFQIIHDGKHVSYYQNGELVRSEPNGNDTFSLQIAFHTPSAAAYGIEFSSVATVVTPFTLVPMSINVACVGTRATSNALGPNGYGNKNFQSKESYTGGCFISASISPVVGAQFIGLSQAPATGAAGGYGPILAGWYPHPDSSICEILFNGADIGAVGATPTAADVFTITYDNFSFRWYRNNTLIYTQAHANAGALYAFGDFFEPGRGFANIAFAPYSPSTPAQFIARGNATVSDSFAGKTGGSTAWDSDIVSIVAYSTCNLIWKASNTTSHFMGGFTTVTPATAGSFAFNYALYCNAGTVSVYEGGAYIGNFGTYTTQDRFSMTYDGTDVVYAQNGSAFRTVAVSGLSLYADLTFNEPGAACNSLDWGPGATVPILDTPQINSNAVSQILSVIDTSNGGSTVSASPQTFAGSTLTMISTGAPVGLDVSGTFNGFSSATGTASITLGILRDGVPIPSGGSYQTGTLAPSTVIQPQAFSIIATDHPTAGSHVYQVYMSLTGATGGSGAFANTFANISECLLKVREYKK